MTELVLIRHGQSTWNLEDRFTGWTDVDLTPRGALQAQAAGRLLKAEGYEFDKAWTSVLKRAVWTLWHALDQMDRTWLPVRHEWRLNERHYGALQGLDKAETAKKFGEAQVLAWRRSYDDKGSFRNYALNVSGNQGLQLELADGRRILLGTRRPGELRQTLEKLRIGQPAS